MNPGDRIADLVVERLLACGGIAEIYVARSAMLHRSFAVKILSQRFQHRADVRQRMETEARALSQFNTHPGIVRIYAASVDPQFGPYIVMDLLEGRTLREILRARRSLGVPRAVAVAVLIADITDDLHASGIIHRDLKPENIFVIGQPNDDFRIVILDLGCIKAPYSIGTTDHAQVMGTLRYMSPEQLRGERPGSTSDQVALGHMLYEMVVGKHAFDCMGPTLKSPLPAWRRGGNCTGACWPLRRTCVRPRSGRSSLVFWRANPPIGTRACAWPPTP